jgi:trimeric autotransporter adhesin
MTARATFVTAARRARRAATWAAVYALWSCSAATTTDAVSGSDVASIEVTPSTSSLSLGAQLPLSAVARDVDGKIVTDASLVWSVKDPGIASVSPSGVVTAVALGTTQIAASANGKSGIAVITVLKTPVANVAVRPTHLDAVTGTHAQLTAITYDAANNILSDRAVVWSSSNTGVATVDATGAVTAVGVGTATITGTAEGKSDAATITVTQASVATVAVTPNPVSLTVGQSSQLTATPRDANGNTVPGRSVSWSSANTAIATVSDSGVMKAIAAGTTTVTATVDGKSGSAAVTVTNVPVASVAVQPQNANLAQGSSVQFVATVKDANGTVVTDRVVVWTSSNDAVASVSPGGVVTGKAAGTATITATSEGVSGSSAVTITATVAAVASVTVDPPTASVSIGQTTTLAATVKDASGNVLTGRSVTWSTSNSGVATVSSSGEVTGVSAGSTTITATSEGKSGTATVTVVVPVASVTVQPTSKTIGVGQTVTLVATTKDASGNVLTGRTITWSSSSPAVASVSSGGVVTGVGGGTATITATSEGKSGTSTITVTPVPVGSVTVTPSPATVVLGKTVQLIATVKDTNGTIVTDRPVTWTSANTNVATVDATGLVKGIGTGTVTITAKSETKSGTSSVTVTLAPVASVTLTPAVDTVPQNQSTTFTVVLKDADGNVLTGRVINWSSSNTSVATVSGGVATGVAIGTATITATSEGQSGSATLVVIQVPVASVTVSPASASIKVNDTKQFTATARDANGNVLTGRTFTWASSDPTIATVTQSGLAKGVNSGTVTITATAEGKSGTATLTVSK